MNLVDCYFPAGITLQASLELQIRRPMGRSVIGYLIL